MFRRRIWGGDIEIEINNQLCIEHDSGGGLGDADRSLGFITLGIVLAQRRHVS